MPVYAATLSCTYLKENCCDHKCQNRYNYPVHKYIVSGPQQAVFPAKHNALRINIPCKAAIKKIAIIHHLLHALVIIFVVHPVKITEEKQVHFLFIYFLLGENSWWNGWAGGQDRTNHGDHANDQ